VPFPRRLLAENEDLVLDLRPHWIALVAPLLITAVLLAAMSFILANIPNSWPSFTRWAVVILAIILFLAFPARRLTRWATSHFVVTSDRLIHRSGWIAKRSMEIPLEKISDVRFHQGVFERLIGAGDITIESPGEFGQERFSDIRNPEHVQKTIYEMGERNQRRMNSSASVPSSPTVSVADELAKLQRLRADGVLTEDEFQAEKSRLLRQG
jgi:uncharacterized membrane protein YdbT with pleckstrin-like domain